MVSLESKINKNIVTIVFILLQVGIGETFTLHVSKMPFWDPAVSKLKKSTPVLSNAESVIQENISVLQNRASELKDYALMLEKNASELQDYALMFDRSASELQDYASFLQKCGTSTCFHSPPHKPRNEIKLAQRARGQENIRNLNLERTAELMPEMSQALIRIGTDSNMETEVSVTIPKHELPDVELFSESLDRFERKFFATTFRQLALSMSPRQRENGMSFVQSGLFLQLALLALSTELGPETRIEVNDCLGLYASDEEIKKLLSATLSYLPTTNADLKFRWSSRLVLHNQVVSERFRDGPAKAMRLQIDDFNTDSTVEMADVLDNMVKVDSGGAIRNTFNEYDLFEDVRSVLLTTLYFRAKWRSAPTVLNGTWPFRDGEAASNSTVRMIRVNDVMMYADIPQWDAEAVEIPYSTPGLRLLILVPRGTSLRPLVEATVNTSLSDVTAEMRPLRIAVALPLFTLRMTLLLPNKLQAINISRLFDITDIDEEFRLTHAFQRIMFWAESGKDAFKDDGIEWGEPPQKEVVVDRPFLFFVRWKNMTIMSGSFVL